MASSTRPKVFLTFDDGPYPVTSSVIDALNEKGLNATFFLNMKWMQNQPDEQYRILRKMLKGGHFLGSHGIDHDPESEEQYKKDYTAKGTANVKKDFDDNLKAITALFKKKNDTFPGFQVARLPGNGSFFKNESGEKVFVKMIVQQLKMAHAAWDFEFFPNGKFLKRKPRLNNWRQLKGVAAETLTHNLPKSGSILLLHEHHWDGTTKDKGSLVQLKEFFKLLKEETEVMPFIPLPVRHPKIQYP